MISVQFQPIIYSLYQSIWIVTKTFKNDRKRRRKYKSELFQFHQSLLLCTETEEFVSFDQLDDAVKELQLEVLYKQEKWKSILQAFVDQMQHKSRNSVSTDREYRRRNGGQRREKRATEVERENLNLERERRRVIMWKWAVSQHASLPQRCRQEPFVIWPKMAPLRDTFFLSRTSILSLFIFKPLCLYLSAPGMLYYPPRLSETQRKWCH